MISLSKVEHAILELLASHDGGEVPGRELRGLLRRRGFRRSAPAFVFTMMNLEDKGLIECREEIFDMDGVEVRDRFYRIRDFETAP
jgi:repressor of nif and glnA expression